MHEDNTSAPANDDLDQSFEAETSLNDDTQDPETALEDIEVSLDEINASDEDDESDDESEEEAVTDSEDETEEDSDSGEDEEPAEEDTAAAEEQKRRNDEFAKQRIAEREARERAKLTQQQEYLDAAEDAKDLALRQLQIEAYNTRVESNKTKLETGIDRAVANIDLFEKGTDVQKEELARSLDLFERLNVQYDDNGDPVVVRGDVYQYLQEQAERIRRLSGDGARQEAKDKKLTKAKVDVLPSKTPKEPKKDEAVEAFDKEASRW